MLDRSRTPMSVFRIGVQFWDFGSSQKAGFRWLNIRKTSFWHYAHRCSRNSRSRIKLKLFRKLKATFSKRARYLSQQIRSEDGKKKAVKAIEEHLNGGSFIYLNMTENICFRSGKLTRRCFAMNKVFLCQKERSYLQL